MKKEKYIIDFCNGITFDFVGTLEKAKKEADDRIGYTQRDVKIRNENDETIAFRRWWGIAFDSAVNDAELSEIIDFGDFGYYDNWVEKI